jgi:hypothetical protein
MSRLTDLLREAGTEIGGQADATGQLLFGLAKQPVAGLTGLSQGVTSLATGKGWEQAAKDAAEQSERVNAWGGPLTERGGQRLQDLGTSIEKAGDWATKNVPGVAQAEQGWDQYSQTHPLAAAGIAGLVEAGPGKGAGTAKRAAKSAIGKAKTAATVEALRAPVIDPVLGAELANRYPMPGPPEMKIDKKKGTTYPGKKQSPEEQQLWAARKLAQKDIDAGDYTPYYDVEKRFHTDPSQFPGVGDTQVSAQPAKQATREQYAAQWDTPEVRARLEEAYLKGAKDPKADRWYGMGQLVDDFNKELGPQAGPQAFRQNFSHPMAATTAMSSPEMNLMQSAYGNYLRNKGTGLPEASHQIPSPVTGPSTLGNLQMYDKVVMQGQGLDPAVQPKRHNFAANFEGYVDPSTIDTRMMGGVDPTGKNIAPPGMTYGTIEKIAQDIGRKHGDTGADSQAKMWVGLGDEPTKPMIQVVNEAIERTHRITGKPKADIVRDSLVKGTHPLYQAAGVAAGGATIADLLRDDETAKGF